MANCEHKFAEQYPNHDICYLCGFHEWWAVGYTKCQKCEKTERPHRQNGLCKRCWELEKYNKHRDLNTLYFQKKRLSWLFRYMPKRKKSGGGITIRFNGRLVELPIKTSYLKNREKDFTLYWLALERLKKLLGGRE